ncbi:acyl-CoA hydrolase [Priestia taiwanensis]|uniref:Acyl-CoA thioesterase n=1 Tax=Priestia taiwanensis TaxID=1347902 RepID=A0A917EPI5_9BACI|nr:acyl-CoA thioesterase [Priestia taiwanensis]MBM7362509.1 acyl-CoA hydrolase [Priestia taiwanensis]GGE62796.1 acyl-CoA thioesterase [Priestia taiwanensis]
MEARYVRESKVMKTSRVFPVDLNSLETLFGGKIVAEMDIIASISAARHSRMNCVTASIDSVDFLCPVRKTDSVDYQSFVVYTGKSSMEVFVKVIAEDLLSGTRRVAATCFVTFVALQDGKPVQIPQVIPETEEEKLLHEIAMDRVKKRKERRTVSAKLARILEVTN